MKPEELTNLRHTYNELVGRRDELLELKKLKEELENNPIVQTYLETKLKYENIKSKYIRNIEEEPDSYFVKKAHEETSITPTKDIYVYIGSYEYSSDDILVSRNSKTADFVIYANLESILYSLEGTVQIPYKKMKEFESIHNIIIPPNEFMAAEYFYKLQKNYFEDVIKNSEEAALEKINKLIKK